MKYIFLFTLLLVAAVSGICSPREGAPTVEQIDEGVYRIGAVIVNRGKRSLSIPGKVNMREGVVEYLAVSVRGKLHESVLVIEAEPLHVQLGLILLGLNYGGNLEYQGDEKIPKGDKVEVWVSWKEIGKEKRLRGEELIYNEASKKCMQITPWIFTGSQIIDCEFMAQVEGSIVATFRDPFAILNNPLPCGTDDTILFANPATIPPLGSKVTLIFQAVEASK